MVNNCPRVFFHTQKFRRKYFFSILKRPVQEKFHLFPWCLLKEQHPFGYLQVYKCDKFWQMWLWLLMCIRLHSQETSVLSGIWLQMDKPISRRWPERNLLLGGSPLERGSWLLSSWGRCSTGLVFILFPESLVHLQNTVSCIHSYLWVKTKFTSSRASSFFFFCYLYLRGPNYKPAPYKYKKKLNINRFASCEWLAFLFASKVLIHLEC